MLTFTSMRELTEHNNNNKIASCSIRAQKLKLNYFQHIGKKSLMYETIKNATKYDPNKPLWNVKLLPFYFSLQQTTVTCVKQWHKHMDCTRLKQTRNKQKRKKRRWTKGNKKKQYEENNAVKLNRTTSNQVEQKHKSDDEIEKNSSWNKINNIFQISSHLIKRKAFYLYHHTGDACIANASMNFEYITAASN